MNNIFLKRCSDTGCAPQGRNAFCSAILPILNAYGIAVPIIGLWYILIAAIICMPFYSSAQHYHFKKYTVAEGLGSSTINNIFQDSRGYIWFATQGGGISRFNGKEFKNYSKTDGLVYNDVTWITEDKKGNIWIATLQGASVFNGSNFRNYRKAQGFTDGRVYGIYADDENKIWFATRDDGIKIFNGKKFDSLTVKDGLPSNEVYSIAKDKAGNLWFGLANGIAKYSDGKITGYNNDGRIKDKTFFSSLSDSSGNIWFGSSQGDVIIIHPDNTLDSFDNSSSMSLLERGIKGEETKKQSYRGSLIEKFELPAACKNDFIGSIAQDNKRNIWFATDHGLLKYDGKDFKLFGEQEGLSANAVQAVMADYEGNIWAGTLSSGVNLFTGAKFVRYTEKNGLTNQNVTAICSDRDDKVYFIGTTEGLFVFDRASQEILQVLGIKEIEKAGIASLSMDRTGSLWVAAQDHVFVLTIEKGRPVLKKKYHRVNGVSIVSPNKIIHDSRGNCWIATFGSGVFCISGTTEKSYNTNTGFSSDNILTVFEDGKSNIWFGTQDAGIIKFDGSSFIPLPTEVGEEVDKSVWCIAEDSRGNIFWGTGQSGLCSYNGKTITNYFTTHGLSSDYITSLQWDKFQNCLWAGSEKGLDKIKFSENRKISHIQTYKEQEGFSSAGINQNGIWLDPQGLVWIGTVNGLWRFDQQFDEVKRIPPRIQLTGIRLFFQNTDWNKFSDSVSHFSDLPANLQLPYNKNHLTFDFQALTTGDALYSFKLEGQEEEWSAPEKNNAITYSNISPGQYTFSAKAITGNGIQSAEIISFPFVIHPPWWKTWWFYLITVVTMISGLIFFIKTRERLLREQNIKLEETVKQRTVVIEQQKQVVEKMLGEKEVLLKEIHHRVKNNLQTISSMLMLQNMELTDAEAKKAITESQSRVRSIALVHQKLYETDGLEKVELSGFVKELTEQIRSLYESQSNSVSVTVNIPEIFILIDKAIPLGLILNELFTNSLKYAFAKTKSGQIRIEAQIIETETVTRKVKLIYSDNGEGFNYKEISEASPTLGVELIQLLSEQIGATITYSNVAGSEFVFIFGINI